MKNMMIALMSVIATTQAYAGDKAELLGPDKVDYQQYTVKTEAGKPLTVNVDRYTYTGCYANFMYNVTKIDRSTYFVNKVALMHPMVMCITERQFMNGTTVELPATNYPSYYELIVPAEANVQLAE